MNAQLSQVTDFVFSLAPENAPAAARRAAALMCLDTLGVAAAATPMQAGRIGRDTAALLHAAGAPSHAAPMLFDGRRVSLAGAAYAAATQTDQRREKSQQGPRLQRKNEQNQGLGAAVRVGLSEGVSRESSAVIFADADGEYPPEELQNLVEPIIQGHADYVVGSRFLGDIEFMRPHRRFGNLVLTRILSIIARRKITDGQSGYRAFSPRAARAAEIIHDFNYAQVITLDLLAKGYIYLEVPISYHFRTTGESFIKLFPYLKKVVPAVYRELNTVH